MCGKFTQMATWEEVVAFSQPLIAIPEGQPGHGVYADAVSRR